MNDTTPPSADGATAVNVTSSFNAISMDPEFLSRVADGMEQGVLVWDINGICVMYTDRVFDVLEMRPTDLVIGIDRRDFLAGAVMRGELDQETADTTQEKFSRKTPFQFDRLLRSGRVIATAARPMTDGGYVVTFTDVTLQRQKSSALIAAKRAAEHAQDQLREALESEKSRQYEASMLAELGDWLQTCKSLEELYRVLKEYMHQMLPDSRGELYIYSNSRDVLDGVVFWGAADIHGHINADACWALRRGRNYSHTSHKISFDCPHVQEKDVVSSGDYICVPIVAHGDTVGLLHIQFPKSGTENTNLLMPHKFVAQCGELISLAIANVRLRDELQHQSTRDPLTGLYNRRHYLESLRNELKLRERKGGSCGVIYFDADRFKSFNDNHGHDAGDMVLRAISGTLGVLFQNDEVLCRYGGEEFMVLLPSATHDETIQAAETLCDRVQELSISYAGRILPTVTVSCGVASFPKNGKQVQDILKIADDAMYLAKKEGRNKVVDASRLNPDKIDAD